MNHGIITAGYALSLAGGELRRGGCWTMGVSLNDGQMRARTKLLLITYLRSSA